MTVRIIRATNVNNGEEGELILSIDKDKAQLAEAAVFTGRLIDSRYCGLRFIYTVEEIKKSDQPGHRYAIMRTYHELGEITCGSTCHVDAYVGIEKNLVLKFNFSNAKKAIPDIYVVLASIKLYLSSKELRGTFRLPDDGPVSTFGGIAAEEWTPPSYEAPNNILIPQESEVATRPRSSSRP
jgi:hypothetical protein